jgi:hypothetical protein
MQKTPQFERIKYKESYAGSKRTPSTLDKEKEPHQRKK